ncbi:MAG: M20/M25/M40 family metallo-hydrolase [Alphaproteobacteria bacterium]|nr:M20/M25/M40 family metallo-hydrolase [Alphaproteobacteria bacterium]
MSADPEGERRVLARIAERLPTTIEEVRAAIRQPSVSATGEGVEAMAAWVRDYLAACGAEAGLARIDGAPIVEGELAAGGGIRPRLLFYELYDVQPAAGQRGWSVDPFAAEIVTAADGRRRLVGRGAFNSKGPLVAALAVFRCFRDAGVELPVDLRFLIEGEEEIGSPSLAPYIARNRAALAACDAAFIPYFGTSSRGDTILRLGFKGLVLLELSVTGGAWGGPARGDVHALHGAAFASPSWQLVRALASLVDADERLHAGVLGAMIPPPSDADRALVAAAARDFDVDAYRRELGLERFKGAGTADDVLQALMFDCTVNIDALAAGSIPPDGDPPTVVPRVARAFLDLRLLPGMDPQAAVAALRRHLDDRGFAHVDLRVRSAYPASRATVGEPVVKALVEAARAEAPKLIVLPIHAGAAPMHVFTEMIGIPYAFGGVGHGAGSHGPDEYILVDDVAPFMRTVARFLFRFAERRTARPP